MGLYGPPWAPNGMPMGTQGLPMAAHSHPMHWSPWVACEFPRPMGSPLAPQALGTVSESNHKFLHQDLRLWSLHTVPTGPTGAAEVVARSATRKTRAGGQDDGSYTSSLKLYAFKNPSSDHIIQSSKSMRIKNRSQSPHEMILLHMNNDTRGTLKTKIRLVLIYY